MDEQLITALINDLALKLGGITVVLTSLIAVLGAIYINRARETDRKDSEKSLHVYKAQFEKEFSSYQELWKFINNLHGQVGIFLRSVKFDENIESNRQKSKKLLYEAQTRSNELVPFIDKSIENIMFDVIDIYSKIHLLTCVYLDGNRPEDLEMIGKDEAISKEMVLKEYETNYSKNSKHQLNLLAVEIRNRLSKLNVQ